MGIWCRICTVDQAISCSQTGAICGGDTRKIQFVATHGDRHSVCFSLVESDTGPTLIVGDFATVWNVAGTNKNTVLVPVGMRVPTPCARRPRSM